MQLHYGPYTAEIDPLGYLVKIEVDHHKIHEGQMFAAAKVFTINDGSANEARIYMAPSAGGGYAHILPVISTDKQCIVQMFESPSLSSYGTNVAAVNLNRAASTATSAGLSVQSGTKFNATGAYYGTMLWEESVGGTTSNQVRAAVGVLRPAAEWVLHNNRTYIIVCRAGAATTRVTLGIEWYEAPVNRARQ